MYIPDWRWGSSNSWHWREHIQIFRLFLRPFGATELAKSSGQAMHISGQSGATIWSPDPLEPTQEPRPENPFQKTEQRSRFADFLPFATFQVFCNVISSEAPAPALRLSREWLGYGNGALAWHFGDPAGSWSCGIVGMPPPVERCRRQRVALHVPPNSPFRPLLSLSICTHVTSDAVNAHCFYTES